MRQHNVLHCKMHCQSNCTAWESLGLNDVWGSILCRTTPTTSKKTRVIIKGLLNQAVARSSQHFNYCQPNIQSLVRAGCAVRVQCFWRRQQPLHKRSVIILSNGFLKPLLILSPITLKSDKMNAKAISRRQGATMEIFPLTETLLFCSSVCTNHTNVWITNWW